MIKSKKKIERALRGKHWTERSAAVRSKYFEAKHMEIALSNKDEYVIIRAKLSNSHEIIKNLDDLLYFIQTYD